MEVEVLGVSGVPEDAIISIRAGASRRQAPVSACGKSGTPFRFAGGPAGVNPFKLDVLQPIGSTRLALKPGGGTFAVPIKGAEGVTVNLAVRDAPVKGGAFGLDLFDRIDADKDGVISRREFNEALRADGARPVLQPLDDGKPIPVVSSDGKNRLPPLPKDEDGRFPAAATAAKEYLESHNLLPFVRALLQTVVREKPDDPFNFIADQFRNASTQPYKPPPRVEEPPKPTEEAAEPAKELPKPTEDVAKKMMPLAKASLLGELPQKLEQPEEQRARTAPDGSQVVSPNAKARDAVQGALETQAVKMGVDFDKLGPQEKEEASYKAQDALDSVLRESVNPPDVQSAKVKARQALTAALFEDGLTENEMVEARDKAKDALVKSLAGEEDTDDIKERAQRALSKAFADEKAPELDRGLSTKVVAPNSPRDNLEDTPDLEGAKQKARNALTAALMEDDGTQGIESAKAKARLALSAALMDDDVEDAKAKARDAMHAALLGDEDNVVEEAKAKARDALASSLIGGNDDVEEAKANAREALTAMLLDSSGDDVEMAKARARDALVSMAASDEEQAKDQARAALAAALFDDDDDDVEPEPGNAGQADVEQAKETARNALAAALLGPAETNGAEEAKSKARNALSAALFTDEDDLQDQAQAAMETTLLRESAGVRSAEDVELAKQSARQALAQALLEEASGPEASSGGDALTVAEQKKAHLTATKEEMGKMNSALKDEISELNMSLESLTKQRDSLRMKMTA